MKYIIIVMLLCGIRLWAEEGRTVTASMLAEAVAASSAGLQDTFDTRNAEKEAAVVYPLFVTGDKVNIILKNDDRIMGKIESIEEDGVVFYGHKIVFSRMTAVSRQLVDPAFNAELRERFVVTRRKQHVESQKPDYSDELDKRLDAEMFKRGFVFMPLSSDRRRANPFNWCSQWLEDGQTVVQEGSPWRYGLYRGEVVLCRDESSSYAVRQLESNEVRLVAPGEVETSILCEGVDDFCLTQYALWYIGRSEWKNPCIAVAIAVSDCARAKYLRTFVREINRLKVQYNAFLKKVIRTGKSTLRDDEQQKLYLMLHNFPGLEDVDDALEHSDLFGALALFNAYIKVVEAASDKSGNGTLITEFLKEKTEKFIERFNTLFQQDFPLEDTFRQRYPRANMMRVCGFTGAERWSAYENVFANSFSAFRKLDTFSPLFNPTRWGAAALDVLCLTRGCSESAALLRNLELELAD